MNDIYKYSLYSDRKSFGTKPNFVSIDKLPSQGFSSLYEVTLDTAKAIVEAGTTKQFKGCVWSEWLKIDVDSYEAAGATESKLIEMNLSFLAFDSGGKGAHFYIMRDNKPSHLLPAMDKAWVKANFESSDLSIYTHLHLFRLPATVHESTGRRKELVTEHHGNILTVASLAQADSFVEIFSQSREKLSVFDSFRVMCELGPKENGERHSSLVRMTYALRDDAKVDKSTAIWWIREANKMYNQPKSEDDLHKILTSIYG